MMRVLGIAVRLPFLPEACTNRMLQVRSDAGHVAIASTYTWTGAIAGAQQWAKRAKP